ncbi:MAG: cadherin-like beta sandwich domain-containing protein [Kofleriaceae bacterium]
MKFWLLVSLAACSSAPKSTSSADASVDAPAMVSPALTSLGVDTANPIAFDPAITSYDTTVSHLVQAVAVSATADPSATITFDGQASNVVPVYGVLPGTIQVESTVGEAKADYLITVHPSADPIAQRGDLLNGILFAGDLDNAATFYFPGMIMSDRSTGTWTQQAIDVKANAAAIDGDTLAIQLGDGTIGMYQRTDRKWLAQATVTPSGATNLNFATVALRDGMLFVGDVADQKIYVFQNQAGTWTQIQMLVGSHTGAGDGFGSAIAYAGGVLVVGAPNEGGNGAAYVWRSSGGTWTETAHVLAPAPSAEQFGASIATDGVTLVVGAPANATRGTNAGCAYVFAASSGTYTTTITGANTMAGDQFGFSVAVNGAYILVGAPGEQSSVGGTNSTPVYGTPFAGAAYLFARDSAWAQDSYIKPNHVQEDLQVGCEVALTPTMALISEMGGVRSFY